MTFRWEVALPVLACYVFSFLFCVFLTKAFSWLRGEEHEVRYKAFAIPIANTCFAVIGLVLFLWDGIQFLYSFMPDPAFAKMVDKALDNAR